MRLPQHFLNEALRPVSGLTSFDLSPSHDCSQWHIDKPTLAYRCGGSSGTTPDSRLTYLQAGKHLKAARTLPRARGSPQRDNLQTASTNFSYRLTYQHFSNYSQRMENELNALESKLMQLIQVSGRLRAENIQLRQELAQALSHNRLCNDKIDSAKVRLEKLLTTLPEENA